MAPAGDAYALKKQKKKQHDLRMSIDLSFDALKELEFKKQREAILWWMVSFLISLL